MIKRFRTIKRASLAVALVAAGMTVATTAQARDRYDDDRGRDAALVIGAGIVGLAIGAALGDRDDRYYRDSNYYHNRRYVRVRGDPYHYYYYPNAPRRYYRDRYYDRYYGNWSQQRKYRHYDRRGYANRDWRGDRYYGKSYRDKRGYGYHDRDHRRYRDRDHRRYRDRDDRRYRRGY